MDFLLAQAQGTSGFGNFIDALARTPLSRVVFFVAACTVARLIIFPLLSRTLPHLRTGGHRFARILNEALDALIYAGVVVFMVIRPFGIQAFTIPSGSMLDTLLVSDYIVANKAVYRYSAPIAGDIVVFRPPAHACTSEQIDTDGQPKVDFIKRCIGAPGDVVEIRAGNLYRNGKPLNEPYRRGGNSNDFKLVRYEGSYAPWRGKYIPVLTDYDGQPNFEVNGISKAFAVGVADDGFLGGGEPFVPPGGWKAIEALTPDEKRVIQELSEAPPTAIPPRHYLLMGDNREDSFDGRAWGLVPEEDVIGRSEFIWLPISRWRATN